MKFRNPAGYCLALASILASPVCGAAPEEIQVYLDEFADVGKWGLDLHTNRVLSAHSGAATRNMLRLTPELSYGINEHWEAALYWLVSAGPEQSAGHPVSDGAKLRLKWRPYAPSKDSPWYFAVNGEVGSLSQRFNADGSSAELKLIGMYTRGPWVAGANLNLDRALKRNPLQAATYELDSKLSYQVRPEAEGGLRLGLENYHFFGPMHAQAGPSQVSNANYLVADFSVKSWDINIGLGKTTGATNDKLVLKAIIGVPFE